MNEINDQYAAGKIKRKLAFLGRDFEKNYFIGVQLNFNAKLSGKNLMKILSYLPWI